MKNEKKKPFDILKTFDLFNREALAVIKNKFLEIIMVETDNVFVKNQQQMFNVDIKNDNTVQITILNDKKTYDLLSYAWHKHKRKLSLAANSYEAQEAEKRKNKIPAKPGKV